MLVWIAWKTLRADQVFPQTHLRRSVDIQNSNIRLCQISQATDTLGVAGPHQNTGPSGVEFPTSSRIDQLGVVAHKRVEHVFGTIEKMLPFFRAA